ncbi:egg cell-secreted protein 1.1-like [Lotus japonicus]|uniref:egg cell-secreted protein 1.1-like n=1 Tax=Lotus japonicus TaxID=34305 RepID=UPI00258E49B4|nr:egg cell-secreted protein 1.1-like [Lotus japonicus]
MASPTKISFLVAFVTCATILVAAPSVVESRPLSKPSTMSLAVRLKLNSGNCWESLMQLQACSGEIIAFFMNGETYIGNGCCQAIKVIGHDCWPNIVASLGFTTQETNILEGYCDEVAAAVHSPPPPSYVVEPNKEIVP